MQNSENNDYQRVSNDDDQNSYQKHQYLRDLPSVETADVIQIISLAVKNMGLT